MVGVNLLSSNLPCVRNCQTELFFAHFCTRKHVAEARARACVCVCVCVCVTVCLLHQQPHRMDKNPSRFHVDSAGGDVHCCCCCCCCCTNNTTCAHTAFLVKLRPYITFNGGGGGVAVVVVYSGYTHDNAINYIAIKKRGGELFTLKYHHHYHYLLLGHRLNNGNIFFHQRVKYVEQQYGDTLLVPFFLIEYLTSQVMSSYCGDNTKHAEITHFPIGRTVKYYFNLL